MREGWEIRSLSSLAKFHSGGTPRKTERDYWGGARPWVTVKDMKSLRFAGTTYSLTDEGANTLRTVPKGSILVLVRGMTLFKDLPVMLCDRPVTFNQDIKALVPLAGIDEEFLAYAITARKSEILRHVDSAGHGTGRLDMELLKAIDLPIPPLPEQRKIAEILRTWDDAIEKTTELRGARVRLYNLLNEALIFDGASNRESRQSYRLGEVTRELTQRNTAANLGPESVMGVSNSKGIVPMRSQTIGADLTRYKILPPQGFAYNPMRLNVGSIAMSSLEADVLVSPDYVLFECIDGALDPDYLDHLRRTHWWSHHVNAGGSGSVRVRTYYDELTSLRVNLPTYFEQRVIARALNATREELDLLDASIAALQRQKRGLMQKLLTGEWRVQGEGTP